MPQFRYEAMASSGETVRGVIEAPSETDAFASLRDQGLFVQRCRPVRGAQQDTRPPGETQKSHVAVKTGSSDSVQPGSRNRRLAIILLFVMLLGSSSFAMLGTWSTWQMTRQIALARETVGVHSTEKLRYYEVKYHYEVDGKQFTSDRVYPGGIFVHGHRPSKRSGGSGPPRFKPGSTTPVFYMPDEPQTAFLKPIRRLENGLFAVGGGLFAAAVTGLLLPLMIPGVGLRFVLAAVLALAAQSLTWLLWTAFLAVPSEQLSGPVDLLRWLLLAYVLICWTALIAQAPPALRPLREATLASVTFGTVMMSLSLFVLIPLRIVVPKVAWLHAFPWVGIVASLLALVLWILGVLTVNSPSDVKTEMENRSS